MGCCVGKEGKEDESKLIASKRLAEDNKLLVRRFYEEVACAKNLGLLDQYISENKFIQHNPSVGDGREALRAAFATWFKNSDRFLLEIVRIGADNDLVFVHAKFTNGNVVSAVADIFRVEAGKITEHWDTIQQVPEDSINSHPMF